MSIQTRLRDLSQALRPDPAHHQVVPNSGSHDHAQKLHAREYVHPSFRAGTTDYVFASLKAVVSSGRFSSVTMVKAT